jgi:uncharacterized protein with GYD domain
MDIEVWYSSSPSRTSSVPSAIIDCYYRRTEMPKYLGLANYMPEGVSGLIKEGGTQRAATVKKAVAAVGGKMEAFYYAFGDYDVIVILDLPDNSTALSLSMAINATEVVTIRITPLMTTAEVDKAAKKNVPYRAPGEAAKRATVRKK